MSFCGKCGTRLDDNAWRCPNCGMPVPGAQEPEPAYREPAYEQPSYDQRAYEQPGYEQRTYDQPAYEQPGYDQRTYDQPAYEQPGYDQRAYDQPAYEQPGYSDPAYRQPDYQESSYENAGFRRQTYDGQSYREPAYDRPERQTVYDGDQRLDFNAGKEAVSDFAGRAISGAKNFAGQIGKKVEDRNAAITARVEEDARRQKEAQQKKKTLRMEEGTKHMSSTELWSWLKQSSKRQMFYTDEPSDMTEDAFMGKIQNRLEQNDVPASVERRTIEWDRSGVNKTVYLVRPETELVNPLSCLVQFNHVGSFTFVEEKTFITPPDLPEVPEKPLPLDAHAAKTAGTLLTYGLIAIVAGIVLAVTITEGLGLLIALAGVVMMICGYFMNQKNRAIREHNAKCAAQERAWNAAWENWKNSIFLHSFQEDINGQLSRIFDAVFETIKQVNSELFSNAKSVEQEESSKMNELEQLIARRKDEYR